MKLYIRFAEEFEEVGCIMINCSGADGGREVVVQIIIIRFGLSQPKLASLRLFVKL